VFVDEILVDTLLSDWIEELNNKDSLLRSFTDGAEEVTRGDIREMVEVYRCNIHMMLVYLGYLVIRG
jgi:hypothetical protein